MYAETELAVQLCKFQHVFRDPTADNVCTSTVLAPVQLWMYVHNKSMYATPAEVHLTVVTHRYLQITCQVHCMHMNGALDRPCMQGPAKVTAKEGCFGHCMN